MSKFLNHIKLYALLLCCSFLLLTNLRVLLAAQEKIDPNAKDAEFQKLQDELNSQYAKEKVVGRFEKEGLSGLTPEDISLTLLSYSHHYTDDSGKPQAFIIAKCSLNISKFEKEAEELKKHLPPHPRPRIILPDSTKTLLGILDVENHKLVTLASPHISIKPVVKFVKLRKDAPEYILITGEQEEGCEDCDPMMEMEVGIIGFDREEKNYKYIFTAKSYEHLEADGPDGGIGYIDRSEVSWSDWINNEYRELIVKTKRKILRLEGRSSAGFKNRKEIYSWNDIKKLYLAERIDDGKIVLSRSDSLRLYEIHQLKEATSKQQDVSPVIRLLDFLGDPNPIIAQDAWHAVWSYMYRHQNKLDKALFHALIQKYLKGNERARREALSFISEDLIKDIEPEYRKMLLNAVDEKKPDFALLNLLSRAGESDVFLVLTKILDKAINEKDGCKASGALAGMKHFAERNVPFSREQRTILRKASMSHLSCKRGAIASQANEILKALEVKELKMLNK